MGTSYPGALDEFTNPQADDGMNLPSHAAQHANANDAIAAIQAELGTNPSGGYDTVKDRLAALATGGGGGGGGGLALVASDVFTAVSGVSLPDDVFDPAFDDYRLVASGMNASNGDPADLRVRLRAGGADDSSSVYSLANWLFDGGNVSIGANGASYWLPNLVYQSSPGWSLTFDLFGPALAEHTRITGAADHTYSTHRMLHFGGRHASASAFDSLSFYPSAGTISGRWALYGYAK